MAGEISPDIMFLAIRPKVVQMHAGGYYVVCMGANRRIRKGQSKNRAKRAQNGRAGHVFVLYAQGQKMHHVGRGGQVAKQGCLGASKCKWRVFAIDLCINKE